MNNVRRVDDYYLSMYQIRVQSVFTLCQDNDSLRYRMREHFLISAEVEPTT